MKKIILLCLIMVLGIITLQAFELKDDYIFLEFPGLDLMEANTIFGLYVTDRADADGFTVFKMYSLQNSERVFEGLGIIKLLDEHEEIKRYLAFIDIAKHQLKMYLMSVGDYYLIGNVLMNDKYYHDVSLCEREYLEDQMGVAF